MKLELYRFLLTELVFLDDYLLNYIDMPQRRNLKIRKFADS